MNYLIMCLILTSIIHISHCFMRAKVEIIRPSINTINKFRQPLTPTYSTTNPVILVEDLSEASITKTSNNVNLAFGLLTFFNGNRMLTEQFINLGIQFPPSLAGMILTTTLLLFVEKYNKVASKSLLETLSPSVSFIRAWLPLFFIPPLIALPVKASLLNSNIVQLLFIIIFGLSFSLATTGWIAQIIPTNNSNADDIVVATPSVSLPAAKIPLILSFITLIITGILFKKGNLTHINNLQFLFGIQSTIASFLMANQWVSIKNQKIFHPILTTAVISIIFHYCFAFLTNQTLLNALQMYYGSNVALGAGDLISSMFGPAIISFGVQLFQFRSIIKLNALKVIISTLLGSLLGLLSSSFLIKLFQFKSNEFAFSFLTRCITSPLALSGAKLTGADPTITALIVVITGLFGGLFGSKWLNFVNVNDPLAQGLALGSAAHGLGATSVSKEPEKFSYAIVSMTLTGLFTVLLMTYKPFLKFLTK